MTTTRAPWAELKVRKVTGQFEDDYGPVYVSPGAVTKLLLAEHRRAVRVVEREIANLEAIKSRSFCNAEIAEAYASITVLHDILAALQKGRT